ncbi:VID27-domain-containing protein [Rhizoclosmatium globosum]|uniref:VID27-domain-containing protein n=1 Tax=Rhizoclosmatium globosum TaxID=329046 RepID=A0A1Y2C6U3_9FUNG|nr:VID27-domain-containing protein [Rhizoclosmatium globosum]|eukprot:ORY42614.1 VID27-domain-containing protein [Rhizoclosmatium globosum]
MFLLKSIGSAIFGRQDTELMKLPSGSLTRITSRTTGATVTVTRQLVYKEATLAVRRTDREFNYQLVCARVFEEGEDEVEQQEDQDENDDDALDDECAFLIDESLKFVALADSPTLSWFDPLSHSNDAFEFKADQTTPATIAAFESLVFASKYERRERKPHADASDAELNAYFDFLRASALNARTASQSPVKKPGGLVGSKTGGVGAAATATAPQMTPGPATQQQQQQQQLQKKKVPVVEKEKEKDATPAQRNSPVPMSLGSTPLAINKNLAAPVAPEGESIVKVVGDLYLYDNRVSQFNLMRESITAEITRTAKYEFNLTIADSVQAYISQPLDSSMNPQFNSHASCFVWLWKQDDGSDSVYPWSVKFADPAQEALFRDAFGACMYESLNKADFLKVKAEDRGYLVNAYQEDVEMEEAEDEEEEEEKEEESESEDEDAFVEATDNSAPGDKTAKITNLTIGHRDRSYFVRGHSIGVLGHPDADSVEYSTVINNVKSLSDNKSFTPTKVLLHDQDRSMLLMRPNEQHTVYRMDLEVGKVVEEWKIDDITPVTEILPEAKGAGMTPSRNLVGINHNSIFRLDPRLETKLVRSESKTYASNVGAFQCATTTASGKLAVGSSKGDIRLYDKLNVRAKTHLPGLGDPVLGIDTTESGKWVVATCKNYLLLVCTEAKDAKSSAKGAVFSGFNKSLGDQKPFPVRLQLRPEHVAYMGGDVSFTPARFNTSNGEDGEGQFEETSIITSTGPYVVTWNFRRVKSGKLNDYTIKQYGSEIVADNFKFGQDKNILVALPEDVCMTSRKSLQTPTKMLKSRSSIVNSPY